MTTVKEAASEFLANKRIAVTGVSRTPQGHGSNAVYKRLRDRGYEGFAVNPDADEVEGDRCYHGLKDIPGGVDVVVIATRSFCFQHPGRIWSNVVGVTSRSSKPTAAESLGNG